VEAIMPNQTRTTGPGDVADERGHFGPSELPGDDAIAPDGGIDEVGVAESSGDTPPTPRTGTHDAAIEDLADPGADANVPEPSKPITTRRDLTAAGPGRSAPS
jgi:hypothetical protein